MKVSVIIAEKAKRGITLYTVNENATVKEAAGILRGNNVGALLLTGKDGQYTGILSERDIIRHCCGETPLDVLKSGDIATTDMLVVQADDDLETARTIMSKHHIRHLPVVDNGKIAGVITVRDVIKVLDEQKDIQIKHLSDYVGGTYGSDVF